VDQDKTVNRVLRDLKMMGLIEEDAGGELRPYLNALFVSGWEVGYKEINQHGNKTIGQYDKRGNLFQTYKSRKEAAKLTGFSVSGIYKSVIKGRPLKGWYWHYLVLPELDLDS